MIVEMKCWEIRTSTEHFNTKLKPKTTNSYSRTGIYNWKKHINLHLALMQFS